MQQSGKFLQQLQKFKICEQLVGRKQIWCGKGQNFNSLAIGRISTDGLQWSISKIMTTKNQYFSKKMTCRAVLIFTLPCSHHNRDKR